MKTPTCTSTHQLMSCAHVMCVYVGQHDRNISDPQELQRVLDEAGTRVPDKMETHLAQPYTHGVMWLYKVRLHFVHFSYEANRNHPPLALLVLFCQKATNPPLPF